MEKMSGRAVALEETIAADAAQTALARPASRLSMADIAALAAITMTGRDLLYPPGPGYSPPRIPQTEESKAAALQAAEEKRARRRAKRAAQR